MNKLITSLVCGTVLSMSLVGASYASTASGTTDLDGTTPGRNGTTTNGGLGTMGTGNRMTNPIRNMDRNNNNTVSPLSNNNRNGNYRATATTNADRDNDVDWGWLGLLGLLGLAGMRSRTKEHR
ncbi:WGxxGxxG family protein [Paenibacillus sp. BR2-3]|uniref:WGxxGxxG family protein n=1 Tax=Paenibacillus sp. BR2-3 TaxID=3048494 RepID=UPI0039775EDB